MGTSHWLQNKDKVVLDDKGMILCDFVPVNNIFLHGDGEVSTQKNSVPFPQVQQESARGIPLNRESIRDFSKGGNSLKQYMLLMRKKIMDNSSNGQIF